MKISIYYVNIILFILISIASESCLRSQSTIFSDSELRSTGGSGGQTGSYEATFSEDGASGQYKVRVPSSYSSEDPAGLLIYLHGDTASDYKSDWLFDPVAEFTNNLNIIAVSVHVPSPYASLSNCQAPCWWSGAKQNGEYLHNLIEHKLFKEYNINKDRIYYTGTSGGSQFITGMFVSRYSGDYGGGAIPVCGGANIYSESVAGGLSTNITDKLKQDFKIFYYTGKADFLYNQTVNSKKSYSDLGVKVGSETYSGTGHCDRSVLEGVQKGFNFFNETSSSQGSDTQDNQDNQDNQGSTQSDTNKNQKNNDMYNYNQWYW